MAIGAEYLGIERAFYVLIGLLFLFYGYFRTIERPAVSVVLTVASLGSRVALAYLMSGERLMGVRGIWMSVPIGWFLAGLTGVLFLIRSRRTAEDPV